MLPWPILKTRADAQNDLLSVQAMIPEAASARVLAAGDRVAEGEVVRAVPASAVGAAKSRCSRTTIRLITKTSRDCAGASMNAARSCRAAG